jgi:methyl coenzyme M reductase subunit D
MTKIKVKHTEQNVIQSLSKKVDCTINVGEKRIGIKPDKIFNHKTGKYEINTTKKFDLGNGSLGKIDFLVNHCNYIKTSTNE